VPLIVALVVERESVLQDSVADVVICFAPIIVTPIVMIVLMIIKLLVEKLLLEKILLLERLKSLSSESGSKKKKHETIAPIKIVPIPITI
jgi:hypothetical protein